MAANLSCKLETSYPTENTDPLQQRWMVAQKLVIENSLHFASGKLIVFNEINNKIHYQTFSIIFGVVHFPTNVTE